MGSKMAKDPILIVSGLSMRFGGLIALRDLDLIVEEGAIHSVIGPNGAGKTTLFNCLMHTIIPSAGEIRFRGKRLERDTPDRTAAAGISRTYQNIRLFREMTVTENLLVGMNLHLKAPWWSILLNTESSRAEEKRAHQEALALLRLIGLETRGDIAAKSLSYGEQRRLEIGRALASKPKLLMLDEPTAGMNPHETSEMMSFIQQVREMFAVTILLIEHQMRVVMALSDQVTVLDNGAKIAEGVPEAVRVHPLVVKAYLGDRANKWTKESASAITTGLVGPSCRGGVAE